jgi:preprotein translocase subunit SecE
MSRIVDTLKVTADELINKVTWPTWDELRKSTIIVLIASFIFAFVIYIMDLGYTYITDFIYELVA